MQKHAILPLFINISSWKTNVLLVTVISDYFQFINYNISKINDIPKIPKTKKKQTVLINNKCRFRLTIFS